MDRSRLTAVALITFAAGLLAGCRITIPDSTQVAMAEVGGLRETAVGRVAFLKKTGFPSTEVERTEVHRAWRKAKGAVNTFVELFLLQVEHEAPNGTLQAALLDPRLGQARAALDEFEQLTEPFTLRRTEVSSEDESRAKLLVEAAAILTAAEKLAELVERWWRAEQARARERWEQRAEAMRLPGWEGVEPVPQKRPDLD